MVFLGQMRELPAIATAAEVPNAVKSFGTTWQQSGHSQFRRLWLARFTRTYPTQLRLSLEARRALGMFISFLDALFFNTRRDIHPALVCGPGLKLWHGLGELHIPKIWYLRAKRL